MARRTGTTDSGSYVALSTRARDMAGSVPAAPDPAPQTLTTAPVPAILGFTPKGQIVRVVGYVREAPDPREGEPAFAQGERIRRWASEGGHQLVAICMDARGAEVPARREGLRAVLGIVAEGAATAVVVPDLTALSPDKIVQEILLRDLRARGAAVVSTSDDDHAALDDPTSDRLRTLVRDILARLDEHTARFADLDAENDGTTDDGVIVELISPEPPEPVERIRPVR